jgi:hypothetical protein
VSSSLHPTNQMAENTSALPTCKSTPIATELSELSLATSGSSATDLGPASSLPLEPMAVESGILVEWLAWLEDAEDSFSMLEEIIETRPDASNICGSSTSFSPRPDSISSRASAAEIVDFLAVIYTPEFVALLSRAWDGLHSAGQVDPELLATFTLGEQAVAAAYCLDWHSYMPRRYRQVHLTFGEAYGSVAGTHTPAVVGQDSGGPLGGGGRWAQFRRCCESAQRIAPPDDHPASPTCEVPEQQRPDISTNSVISDLDASPFTLQLDPPARHATLFHGTIQSNLGRFKLFGISPSHWPTTQSLGPAFNTSNSASHALMHASHVHLRLSDKDASCLFAFQIDLDVLLGRTAPAGFASPFQVRVFEDTAADDTRLLEVSVPLLSARAHTAI